MSTALKLAWALPSLGPELSAFAKAGLGFNASRIHELLLCLDRQWLSVFKDLGFRLSVLPPFSTLTLTARVVSFALACQCQLLGP